MQCDFAAMTLFGAVIGGALVATVRGQLAYRARRRKKHRVGDDELLATCPVDLEPSEWIESRRVVAESVGLDAEELDPTESIAVVTAFHTVLWLPSVDFDHVVEDEFVFRDREFPGGIDTVGELMRVVALARHPRTPSS